MITVIFIRPEVAQGVVGVACDRADLAVRGVDVGRADHAAGAVQFVIESERVAPEVVGNRGDVAVEVVVVGRCPAHGICLLFKAAVPFAAIVFVADGVAVGVGDGARFAVQVQRFVDGAAFLVEGFDDVAGFVVFKAYAVAVSVGGLGEVASFEVAAQVGIGVAG